MREIALHLLDIAQNSIAAGAKTVRIQVDESLEQDRLRVVVEDDGRGMDEALLARAADPFVTSRSTRRVGLGLSLLKAAAEAAGGGLRITSAPGQGTRVEAEFQRSHIDRMPLGDLPGTLLTLVVGSPTVRWLFQYRKNGAAFAFDSDDLRQAVDDTPLTEPAILRFIREYLEAGVRRVAEHQTLAWSSPVRNGKGEQQEQIS